MQRRRHRRRWSSPKSPRTLGPGGGVLAGRAAAGASSCRPGSAKPTSICGERRSSGSPANRHRRSPRPRPTTSALPTRSGPRTSSSTSSGKSICSPPTGPTSWSATPPASIRTPSRKPISTLRQITNALSPSNFVLTNPELLRETLTSNAENLVRGMHMLAEDIAAGGGHLKIAAVRCLDVRGRTQPRRPRPAK